MVDSQFVQYCVEEWSGGQNIDHPAKVAQSVENQAKIKLYGSNKVQFSMTVTENLPILNFLWNFCHKTYQLFSSCS